MFQEFFEGMGNRALSGNRYIGTIVTIAVAMLFTFTGTRAALWPMFGSANQLLASLTLLAVTLWLAKLGKDNRFIKYPMYFMFCVTLTALVLLAYNNFAAKNIPLIVMSILLLGVAITLVIKAMKSLEKIKEQSRIETV